MVRQPDECLATLAAVRMIMHASNVTALTNADDDIET